MRDPRPGGVRVVGERYEIVREIGRGGMGTVYLARDTQRDLAVALKMVTRVDPVRVAHLKREFRVVAELRHPGLVELYELTASPGGCWFTMELIDGVDPRAWVRGPAGPVAGDGTDDAPTASADGGVTPSVRASGRAPGRALFDQPTAASDAPPPPLSVRPPPRALPLDVARLRETLTGLADGLAFLHARGVVHRDVKPSNALVRRDGRVALLDFGLAFDWRAVESGGASTGPIVGTVAYMAPEYLHGHRVSPAMDLYALGVLGFELVTGAPPFDGSFYEVVAAHVEQRAPRAIAFNPAVPDDLDEVIAQLLAKEPAARPSAEELVEMLRGERRVTRRLPPRRPRFVGREAELAAVDAALGAARAGAAQLVVVGGPSGAGKTALCDEVIARAPLRDVRVWRGRCHERERVPYRAFDTIIDGLAGELAEEAAARDAAGGDAAPAVVIELPWAASLLRAFPALAPALAAVVGVPAAAVADLRVERERAFAALAQLLRRVVDDRAALIVLDDLQWADDGSVELLEVLLAGPAWPALVIACYATGPDGEAPPALAGLIARAERDGRHLRLGALDDGRLAELVRSIAPGADAGAIAGVVRAAAGSPYLAELVATEVDLAGDGAAARTGNGAEGAEVRRLDRLDAAARAVADAAAAAGGAVSFAQLRHVTALDPAALQSALRGLELERVLRVAPTGPGEPGEVAYDHYHARLRVAAYDALAVAPRRALHARLAGWFEARAGERPAREALAHHWERAGEPARAAPWALAAADAAMAQLAFEHAARGYARALRLGLPAADAARARARAADALLCSGEFAEAAAACRALAGEHAGVERDRWLLRAAEAELKLGEVGAGLVLIDGLLAPRGLRWRGRGAAGAARAALHAARLIVRGAVPARVRGVVPARVRAGGGGDDVLAGAYRVVASFLSTPYPVEAFEYVLGSIELARERGDVAGEGMGLAMVAAYLATGTLGRAGEGLLARAVALTRRAREPYAEMVCEAAAGIVATLRGAWGEMRAAHGRGDEICRELGFERSWEASFLRSYHALGELYAGEPARALALLEAQAARADDLFTRALIGSYRGRALLAAGRAGEAAVALDALARDPAAARGMPRMYRYALEGELALATARWDEARRVADEMAVVARAEWLALLPAVAALRDVIAATAELGRAQAGGRDAAAAAERARAAAAGLGRRARGSYSAPTARRLAAQAEAARGRRREARELLEQAEAAARARGGRIERAAIGKLLRGAAVDEDLRAAAAWMTAGAVS